MTFDKINYENSQFQHLFKKKKSIKKKVLSNTVIGITNKNITISTCKLNSIIHSVKIQFNYHKKLNQQLITKHKGYVTFYSKKKKYRYHEYTNTKIFYFPCIQTLKTTHGKIIHASHKKNIVNVTFCRHAT